ncbi:NADH-quinone oxidoreductase subunit NuoE, partial [Mycolicibacterium moriokaense]
NWEFFDNQTPTTARELVDALREGQPPTPSRGAPLCSFRETARFLAGLQQHSDDTGVASAPTLAGLRAAQERGMTARGLEGED